MALVGAEDGARHGRQGKAATGMHAWPMGRPGSGTRALSSRRTGEGRSAHGSGDRQLIQQTLRGAGGRDAAGMAANYQPATAQPAGNRAGTKGSSGDGKAAGADLVKRLSISERARGGAGGFCRATGCARIVAGAIEDAWG